MEDVRITAEIGRLQRRKLALSRLIERAYLRESITDYLALENQYKKVVLLINRLLNSLESASARRMRRFIETKV